MYKKDLNNFFTSNKVILYTKFLSILTIIMIIKCHGKIEKKDNIRSF